MHDQLAGDDRYAGGIGWCAFDYNTHSNFGSGDRICYHGVSDIFRIPKPAACFYKSQCEPEEEMVSGGRVFLVGRRSIRRRPGRGRCRILSNCDHLKIYADGQLMQEPDPDRRTFPNLKYPPFRMDLGTFWGPWGDLRIEGYIKGKLAKTLILSGSGRDADFKVLADDQELAADGRDATRVVLMVTDEYGNIRPLATGAIALSLTGPGEIVGENPFALAGGAGAVWIKATESAGTIRLTARHPYLGERSIEIEVKPAPAELI